MPKSQIPPLPRIWLMTDERSERMLLPSIAALPPRSGIIFRHYSLPPADRQALLGDVAACARRHGHVLIIAGRGIACRRWRHAGRHGRFRGALTAPVHSRREAIAAIRAGARLLFVSPLFPTRSHPGATPLGRCRFGLLINGLGSGIIALGGMNARKARSLKPMSIHGWAAIDSLAASR